MSTKVQKNEEKNKVDLPIEIFAEFDSLFTFFTELI